MFWIGEIHGGFKLVVDVDLKGRYYMVEISEFAPKSRQSENRFQLPIPSPGIELLKVWIWIERSLAKATKENEIYNLTKIKYKTNASSV